jgi:hypothetical protein
MNEYGKEFKKNAIAMNDPNDDERRTSLRHLLHLQSRISTIEMEPPKSFQEEIKSGTIKLKPLPKNINDKKPIKVTPLSNDPQISMAIKMKQNNQVDESSEDDEYEDD